MFGVKPNDFYLVIDQERSTESKMNIRSSSTATSSRSQSRVDKLNNNTSSSAGSNASTSSKPRKSRSKSRQRRGISSATTVKCEECKEMKELVEYLAHTPECGRTVDEFVSPILKEHDQSDLIVNSSPRRYYRVKDSPSFISFNSLP